MAKTDPKIALAKKDAEIGRFIWLASNKDIDMKQMTYFLMGSFVVHTLLTSLGQKCSWRPDDVDLTFGGYQADFNTIEKHLRNSKKNTVEDIGDSYGRECKNYTVKSFTLSEPLNFIQMPYNIGASRSKLLDNYFEYTDLSTFCVVYDPHQNDIYLNENADECIRNREIRINPLYYNTVLAEAIKTKNHTPTSVIRANKTIERIQKYLNRDFEIKDDKTIEQIKDIKKFLNPS